MTPPEIANRLIAECERGFRDEHHHAGWRKKHDAEIAALPSVLRERVLIAHEQSTSIVYSEAEADK